MPQLKDICAYLEQFAPSALAEQWDNVGLLAGDPAAHIARSMTCLTVTPGTAEEAVRREANLVITHHPLPFRPLKRLAATTTPGQLLWKLISHRVAIYSPHTAFDSALRGINQQLAEGLKLNGIVPLIPMEGEHEGTGSGRRGTLNEPTSLRKLASRLCKFLRIEELRFVGDLDSTIQHVAVACGAAGDFLSAAQQAKCELLVVGETNFHTCLEAEASNVALLLPGHFASERFAVERLAETVSARFPDLEVWASITESDPVRRFG